MLHVAHNTRHDGVRSRWPWSRAAAGRGHETAVPAGSGATSSDAPLSMFERQELIELRRKFTQVQLARDILAKATA